MNNSYYDKPLYIAEVDEKNSIIGPVERWEAHKNGILHRGFTVIMVFNGNYILQHRKNPIFNNTWDFSFSSHQLYEGKMLLTDAESIERSLKREWNINLTMLVRPPQLLGKVYYKAKDPHSVFTEHEIDYVYVVELKKLPKPNMDFAYGYEMIPESDQLSKVLTKYPLSPWVEKILQEIRLQQSYPELQ